MPQEFGCFFRPHFCCWQIIIFAESDRSNRIKRNIQDLAASLPQGPLLSHLSPSAYPTERKVRVVESVRCRTSIAESSSFPSFLLISPISKGIENPDISYISEKKNESCCHHTLTDGSQQQNLFLFFSVNFQSSNGNLIHGNSHNSPSPQKPVFPLFLRKGRWGRERKEEGGYGSNALKIGCFLCMYPLLFCLFSLFFLS